MKVLMIHGYQGTNDNGWFSPVQKRLNQLKIPFESPNLPDPYHPIFQDWSNCLTKIINQMNTDSINVVGHSLGCFTILRIIDQSTDFNLLKKIKHLILVAPIVGYLKKMPEFTDYSFNFQNFLQFQIKISIFYSVDDNYTPPSEIDNFINSFPSKDNIKYIKENNYEHFMGNDYPIITNYVESICKQT